MSKHNKQLLFSGLLTSVLLTSCGTMRGTVTTTNVAQEPADKPSSAVTFADVGHGMIENSSNFFTSCDIFRDRDVQSFKLTGNKTLDTAYNGTTTVVELSAAPAIIPLRGLVSFGLNAMQDIGEMADVYTPSRKFNHETSNTLKFFKDTGKNIAELVYMPVYHFGKFAWDAIWGTGTAIKNLAAAKPEPMTPPKRIAQTDDSDPKL